MNRREFSTGLIGGALAGLAPELAFAAKQPKRVLVLAYAAGYRHASIPTAAATVARLGTETGLWTVTETLTTPEQVAAGITAARLAGADLVFFANTTGNLPITEAGKQEFYAWIQQGGGWAGVHSAADTFHGDERYLNLVGAEFKTHGPQVKVSVHCDDRKHPATRDLPAQFEVFDEIYEFKNWSREKVHMLLSMDKHPQTGKPGDYAVAMCKRVGKGRAFYTSLGHRKDMYANPLYLKHLTGGLKWALGLAKGSAKPGNPQAK